MTLVVEAHLNTVQSRQTCWIGFQTVDPLTGSACFTQRLVGWTDMGLGKTFIGDQEEQKTPSNHARQFRKDLRLKKTRVKVEQLAHA